MAVYSRRVDDLRRTSLRQVEAVTDVESAFIRDLETLAQLPQSLPRLVVSVATLVALTVYIAAISQVGLILWIALAGLSIHLVLREFGEAAGNVEELDRSIAEVDQLATQALAGQCLLRLHRGDGGEPILTLDPR